MSKKNKTECSHVLHVGIASPEQYKQRTMAIARGEYVPGEDEPKIWFSSLESFSRILSDKNRALLALIAQNEPDSLQQLVEMSGRAKSNLSRTLKTLEQYGLVYFEGVSRKKAPRVTFSKVHLALSLRAS